LCGCGGDTHESLAASSVTTLKELVATFETVKDQATAKAAKPKLKTLMEQMNKINERQAKLEAPTEDEIKSMDKKYGKEMEELQHKFAGEMLRIAFDPKIRAELDDLEQSMKKVQ
jgi:hypothetical protein